MRRIAILGCSGSGKSTLASRLGAMTGLPVICLDVHFWNPGWVETPLEDWERRERELLAADAWIADGNYGRTLSIRLERADTMVYLDRSRWRCMARVVGRWWRHRGKVVRASMGPGCPEKVDAEFLRWIWNFPRDVRPGTLARLEEFRRSGGRVVILRSDRHVAAFLDGVTGGR